MLARIRKSMEEREEGFTLVELLVVVIIIGILAAIAIPTFLNQRQKAWERSAMSDLRNAATVMESFYGDAGTYAATTGVTEPAFKSSDSTVITMESRSDAAYCLEADHPKLADNWKFDSATGSPVKGTC